MKKLDNQTNPSVLKADKQAKKELPEYPLNPADEYNFRKSKEEENINPEDISKVKEIRRTQS